MNNKQTNTSNSASGGIGFTGLLTIAFIVLKLLNVINWSWWWVLSPLWIGTGLVILILAVVFIAALISACAEEKRNK